MALLSALALIVTQEGATKPKTVELDLTTKKRVTVRGQLTETNDPPSYTFRAKKGTRLKVTLKTKKGSKAVLHWSIAFPSGETFGSGKGFDPFDGRLTEEGTYTLGIHVNNMASDGRSAKYTLTVARN